MNDFLNKLKIVIYNSNEAEKEKFIFLLSFCVNVPELKVVFDYLLELVEQNKVSIIFRLDKEINKALKSIGKVYKTAFDGNSYIFSIQNLNIVSIIECIMPYIFINFIKDKEELMNLMTLFCQDLFNCTNTAFNKRMILHLIEEKLHLKLDPYNKGGFVINENKNNEYLNHFYIKHRMYNKINGCDNNADNLMENFVKFIFTIFCYSKEFVEKTNYMRYLGEKLRERCVKDNLEYYYRELSSGECNILFTYDDFASVFENFMSVFKNVLKRIKENTSISLQFLSNDLKNNYEEYMKNHCLSGLGAVDNRVSNMKKMVSSVGDFFGENLLSGGEAGE